MWSLKLIVLSLTLNFKIANSKNTEKVIVDEDEDYVVYRKYMEMDKQLKEMVNYGVKRALPVLMEASENMKLSPSCVNNILLLTTGLRKLKLSAIKFLDASGKISSGFLDGNMHMLGDYEQCLNATMELRNGENAFKGQYCLIHYRPLLPKKKRPVTFHSGIEELVEATKNTSEVTQFLVSKGHLFYYTASKFGACVPTGCNQEDVDQIVKQVADRMFFNASVVYCDTGEEKFLNSKKIIFICLFVLIGILAVIGSLVEYYYRKQDGISKNAVKMGLMCFSILTNFPKAISSKSGSSTIHCLHGIRSLTLLYVILLHQYYAIVTYYMSSHVILTSDEIPQFFMQIVTNGFLTADVFFFLGGLVNCYTRMKDTESRSKNILVIVLHRIWRIAPVYLFFCLMMALFKPYGPMRVFEKTEFVDKCVNKWWQNALFINNFFPQTDTCAPHTWYIAADMQLFLFSLFTVPLFFRHPKCGIILNSAVICSGILGTVVWSWLTNLTPGVIFYRPNEEEIQKAWDAHTSTLPHVAPYFTGIIIGYLLSVKKDLKDFKIPMVYQVIGWPVAAFLFTSMLFMTKIWNSGGHFLQVESSLYLGFSKFIYVIAVAWMVFCCSTGHGGIINYILCLPVWTVISRLSFVVYLIAPFLQTFYFANSRIIIDGHRMPLLWRYGGDIIYSCALGLVFFVLLESPTAALEKLLFHKRTLKTEKTAKSYEHDIPKTLDVKPANYCELQLEPEKILSFM